MAPGLAWVTMDRADVDRWFGEYLRAFAACGRGESETGSLLAYYGVPLLLSAENGFVALTTGEEVVAMAQRQVDGMRAADYDHSDVLDSQISPRQQHSPLEVDPPACLHGAPLRPEGTTPATAWIRQSGRPVVDAVKAVRSGAGGRPARLQHVDAGHTETCIHRRRAL